MSIYARIKHWWTVKQNRRREWWLEPLQKELMYQSGAILKRLEAVERKQVTYTRESVTIAPVEDREPREFNYERRQY